MRKFLVLLMFVGLLVPAAVAAQAPDERPALGFSLGFWGPLTSSWGSGVTGRFNAELPFQGPTSIRFTAGFADLDRGSRGLRRNADLSFATAGILHRIPGAPARMFLHGGLGLYRIANGGNSTELGLSGGVGADVALALKRVSLVPELTTHVITGDGPRVSITATVGLRFGLP